MDKKEKIELEIQILTDICNCFELDYVTFQDCLNKEKLQKVRDKYIGLLGEDTKWS